jgi:hypothetical protein
MMASLMVVSVSDWGGFEFSMRHNLCTVDRRCKVCAAQKCVASVGGRSAGWYRVQHNMSPTATMAPKLGGIYLENSILQDFLDFPDAFGAGPFVVSEYSLAEKARLNDASYKTFISGVAPRVHFLRVPPPSQLIDGKLDPRWKEPSRLDVLNVTGAIEGKDEGRRRLDQLCDGIAMHRRENYQVLRPKWDEWIDRIENPENWPTEDVPEDGWADPRKPNQLPQLVETFAAGALGITESPGPDSPSSEWLRWHMTCWEMGMTMLRIHRTVHKSKELRNDPIDMVHYALSATYCEKILVKERDMKRIHDILPTPKGTLQRVSVDCGTIVNIP